MELSSKGESSFVKFPRVRVGIYNGSDRKVIGHGIRGYGLFGWPTFVD